MRQGLREDLSQALQVVSSGIRVADGRLRAGRVQEARALLADIAVSMNIANSVVRQTRRPALRSVRTPVHVAAVLFRLRTPIGAILGRRHTLRIAVAPNLPPIECVEDEFRNVIIDLVVNSRDATLSGGDISIEARNAPSLVSGERPAVVISITGTGHDVSEASAGRAIRPCFDTRAEAYASGLGLQMAVRYARALGGSATIEDTQGGRTIALYFPSQGRR